MTDSKKQIKKTGKKAVKSVKGKRRTNYKQGTSVEYELELFLKYFFEDVEDKVIFRTAASQTPADVWCVMRSQKTKDGSTIRLYQCKSTAVGLEPPEIDQEEFNKFVLYCFSIGARGYWVDRWKKNKNVYIRRMRFIDLEKCYNVPVFYDCIKDWSNALRIAQKRERELKASS